MGRLQHVGHTAGTRAGPATHAGRPWPTAPFSGCQACEEGPEAGQLAAPGLGMLVCKLRLYHIIMRCLGYQQISRRLGREGCSTIRKCQFATSSFCRSLNPIFPTCISAAGTGPSAGTGTRRAQQEQRYGDPPAPAAPAPPGPPAPQAELARHQQGRRGGWGAAAEGSPAWVGTLSCTTGAHGGGPEACGACAEGHSVSGGAGAPKGHHGYTGVCRGVT